MQFDFYQNLFTANLIIITLALGLIFGCERKNDIKIILALFFWHLFFSFMYYFFTLYNVADAVKYYEKSLLNNQELYPGSPFIFYLSSIFSKGLNASYLNVTLVYNFIGFLGLLYFYKSINKYLKKMNFLWFGILFIPSMSFWSSGLGKDAISFFSVCLFLYAVTNGSRMYMYLIIAFISMFMVRPHIALMIAVSFIVYFIIKSKVHILFKIFTLPIIFASVMFSSSFVQQYVGLEEASIDSVSNYVDQRQGYNQSGGSSIDLQSMSYPVQIFTYIFRPLPFDAHSALALFTSVENSILLILFIYILFKNRFKVNYFTEGKNTWLLIYMILTCSMLAITTANLGIATRQKWMFMPIFLYLLIYAFYQYKQTQHVISIKK